VKSIDTIETLENNKDACCMKMKTNEHRRKFEAFAWISPEDKNLRNAGSKVSVIYIQTTLHKLSFKNKYVYEIKCISNAELF
jgi:hypothetical protein